MEIILKTKKTESAMALLFGIKDLSIEENLITLEQLEKINRDNIFISLNKNMFNTDLDLLEKTLKKLNDLKVKGIFFYDLAVLSITKRLNLDLNLIWAADFLTTNYKTCDFYFNEGVKGVLISNVLTKEEIIEISKNTKLDTFVNIFGYQMMAISKRHFISNYFSYIDEENNNNVHTISEKDKKYLIDEEDYGTKLYSNYILNGIKYLKELKDANVKYIILNDYNLEEDLFTKIVDIYKKAVTFNYDLNNLDEEINNLIKTDTGFFDKKTIYKVKKK